VARADLLTTRSVRPKVPADPSAKRARTGGSVAACGRASVGTALTTTVRRRGVAAALPARRRRGVAAALSARRRRGVRTTLATTVHCRGVATALPAHRRRAISATLATSSGRRGVATALARHCGVAIALTTDRCGRTISAARGGKGGVHSSLPADSKGIDLPLCPRCVRAGVEAFTASRSDRPVVTSLAAGR